MGEAKPLASLSSTLLARKGHAKPAMRPQGFANLGFPATHDDLGWNDMGHDSDVPEPTKRDHGLGAVAEPASSEQHTASHSADVVPIVPSARIVPDDLPPPPVREQQETIAREMTPQLMRAPRAAAGSKGKAAFTLRLDPDRHLRLRLACAVTHKSAQVVVTEALDAFLAANPAFADLARAAGAPSAA